MCWGVRMQSVSRAHDVMMSVPLCKLQATAVSSIVLSYRTVHANYTWWEGYVLTWRDQGLKMVTNYCLMRYLLSRIIRPVSYMLFAKQYLQLVLAGSRISLIGFSYFCVYNFMTRSSCNYTKQMNPGNQFQFSSASLMDMKLGSQFHLFGC